MKIQIPRLVEVEVATLKLTLPDNYDGEDFGENFPFHDREKEVCVLSIDLSGNNSAVIRDWPASAGPRELFCTVKDTGTYELLDAAGRRLAIKEDDYVPHSLVPGEYGDVVNLKIDAAGRITNWAPKIEDFVGEFFASE